MVVAPEDGKVAADQVRLILLEDVALALSPEACAVGGFDSE